MDKRILNDWSDRADIVASFGEPGALDGAEVLFASYTYENYSGSATVIFRRDGKLYEAHGSHCSCYGLEDQWSPEETFLEALRKQTHSYEGAEFTSAWAEMLAELAFEQDGGAGL